MSYGLTMNCAITEQDGQYKMGVHFKNSDGIDIDYETQGDTPDEVIEDAFLDVFDMYNNQVQQLKQAEEAKKNEEVEEKLPDNLYIKQLEEIINDLSQENESLKTDNAILQRRADDAVNSALQDKKPEKIAERKTNASNLFYNLLKEKDIQDELNYLSKLLGY